MTKTDLINDVAYELRDYLTKEQIDRVKITVLVKLEGYEVQESKQLPQVQDHDNEWILKRYWIDAVAAGLKESTIRGYLGRVREFLEYAQKNYLYITAQDITDFLAVKTYRDHIGQNYKSTLYRYLSAFFEWAFRKKHIPENIIDGVDKVKQVKKQKVRLTDDEIEDIRDVLETPKERALFELMLSTGMRVGEISYLNVSDVDLVQKRVRIWGEKTSQYRTGMLNPKAVKALRNYIRDRSGNEPLFVSDRKPYGRMHNPAIEKVAKEVAVRAGVTRIETTVHVYRKTFASVLYRKTHDVLLVSKLLGHAKTDMTVQYYLVDDIEEMQHRYSAVA